MTPKPSDFFGSIITPSEVSNIFWGSWVSAKIIAPAPNQQDSPESQSPVNFVEGDFYLATAYNILRNPWLTLPLA